MARANGASLVGHWNQRAKADVQMAMASHHPPAGRRSRYLAVVPMALAACVLLAAGCGSATAPGSSGSGSVRSSGSPGTAANTTASAKVSLAVTFIRPGSAAKQWTLRCDPPGGSFPDAATACAKLKRAGDLFTPLRGHVMCPMIMATAERASVRGTYYGKPVHMTFIDGGCTMAKWHTLRDIFNSR